MEFEGKVVVITGASSGIGAATAVHFSKLKANLALVARNETNLKKTTYACDENNYKPLLIVADVTKDSDIQRIINETIQTFGKIDILINNAALSDLGGIKNTTMDEYDNVMNTNMRSVFFLTKLALPHLIKSKGNIINISSVCGIKAGIGPLAYSLSKAAMDQFTKCLAVELAGDGVRVNSVNPGVVKTEMMVHIGISEEQMRDNFKVMEKKTPLKRLVERDDVAKLIEFLVSDNSRNMTGTLSVLDGGMVL